MPVFFWGDTDGSKYRSAYFEAFRGEEVWAHGDHVEVEEDGSNQNAGLIDSGVDRLG